MKKQEHSTEQEDIKYTQEELDSKLAEQKEQFLRIIAEYENKMKRCTIDAQHIIASNVENLVIKLTPVAHGLKASIEGTDGNTRIGLEMIAKDFTNTLKESGIEEIAPIVGDTFDPHLHQAISSEENHDLEDGEIIKIMQPGYKFKNRIITTAMVIINKKESSI